MIPTLLVSIQPVFAWLRWLTQGLLNQRWPENLTALPFLEGEGRMLSGMQES
jgi:hypothetical protein